MAYNKPRDPSKVENNIKITGWLMEADIEFGNGEKGAYVKVAGVVQYGEEEYETMKFSFKSNELTASGAESKAYPKAYNFWSKIDEEGLSEASIAKSEDPNRDPVRISLEGKFSDSYFWTAEDDEFKEYLGININFCNLAKNSEANGAIFRCDVFIDTIATEEDPQTQMPTGRLILSGYMWDYGADQEVKIIPFDKFYISEDDAEAASSLFGDGQCMAWIKGTWRSEEIIKKRAMGFGGDEETSYVSQIRMITKSSDLYTESDPRFVHVDGDAIEAALKERDIVIAAKKKARDENKNNASTSVARPSVPTARPSAARPSVPTARPSAARRNRSTTF